MKIPICDPHVHFFNLEIGHYNWLEEHNPPHFLDKTKIAKNFSEEDISQYSELDLQAYVHIEAGFDNAAPWRELEWLAQSCALPMRTIAYLELTQSPHAFCHKIKQLEEYSSLVGIRHIIDEEVTQAATIGNVQKNLQTLQESKLIFELHLKLSDLNKANTIYELLLRTPDLKLVINHAGFAPHHCSDAFKNWEKGLAKFALLPNCWLKVSGFEMVDRQYSIESVERVLIACIKIFSERRVMLASNFPLVNFSYNYQEYWLLVIQAIKNKGLNTEALTLNNAKQFYSIT